MALYTKVGQFTGGLSTGDKAITGLGFQPKALILWTTGMNGHGTGDLETQMRGLIGFATSASNQYSISAASDSGSTSDASRRMATKLISHVNPGETTGTEADLKSFDADGFTITVTAASAIHTYVYLALGGDDITGAKVVNWTMPTSTGNKAVTGVGFQPDLILNAWTSGITAALPASVVSAGLGLGAADGTNQWALDTFASDNKAISDTQRGQQTDAAILVISNGLTVLAEGALGSLDSDGFTHNFGTVNSAYQVVTLCLKGPKVQVGAVNKATGAAPASQDISTPFNPSAVLLASFQDITRASPVEHAHFGIGASDGTNHWSSFYSDKDAAATADVSVANRNAAFAKETTFDGVDAANATAAMGSQKVTLTWSPNDAVATELLYVAFGGSINGAASLKAGGQLTATAGGGTIEASASLKAAGQLTAGSSVARTGSASLKAAGRLIAAGSVPVIAKAAQLAHHGTPRSQPRVHLFDAPNGRPISDDLGLVAEGLRYTTKLPGGFDLASFALKRDGLENWPDLKPFAHVEIRDQGVLVFAGRLMPVARGNQFAVSCTVVGYYFSHLADNEFDSSSSSNRKPKAAIEEVVAQAAPLIVVLPGLVQDHDSWTVNLSQQNYRRIRPVDLFDQFSTLGDNAGNIWDVAVWDQQRIWFQPRDYTRVTHQLDTAEGVIEIVPDPSELWNEVRVEYRTTAGATAVTGTYRDQDSIDRYGVTRSITLRENEITASMAASLAQTFLAFHKHLHPKISIKTTRIFNAAGGPVPCGQVRAGAVVRVPGIGDLFIVETDYDAESGELTLTPEHGFRDADMAKRLMLTEQRVRQQALNQSSGYTGTRVNPDVMRSDGAYDKATSDGKYALIADVYNKSQAQNQFVDAAGDTMSGALTVNAKFTVGNNGGSLIQGNSHFGSVGVGTDADGVTGNMKVAGALNVLGTKNSLIIEPDDSETRFAAQEGDVARFVTTVDLTPEEAALSWPELGPLIVSRLPAPFTRNVDAPYMVHLTDLLGADGAPAGQRAMVIAPARSDLPCQMVPFGMEPVTE